MATPQRQKTSIVIPAAHRDVLPLQALVMLQLEGSEACEGCYGQQPCPTQPLAPYATGGRAAVRNRVSAYQVMSCRVIQWQPVDASCSHYKVEAD